jgi:hypothetical protein
MESRELKRSDKRSRAVSSKGDGGVGMRIFDRVVADVLVEDGPDGGLQHSPPNWNCEIIFNQTFVRILLRDGDSGGGREGGWGE